MGGGGGGGGGGGYFPNSPQNLQGLMEESQRDAKQKALEGEINGYLQSLLTVLNERNSKAIRDQLEKIIESLGERIAVERLLFGGSVSKHTYVDGISDIDALVILDANKYAGKTSGQVIGSVFRHLKDALPSTLCKDIRKGEMAVTVTLHNGIELQLVPALKSGRVVSVPDRRTGWISTDPKAFQQQLTSHNDRLGGTLVPAIKLVKSVVGDLPEQKRIGGYHVEALAVDAAKVYSGPNTVKAVVTHLLKHASERVLSPISDATGQSGLIDKDLGGANSTPRRIVADALAAIGRRLNAASSVEQWKAVFE